MASGTWHPARGGSQQGYTAAAEGETKPGVKACVLRQLWSRDWHDRLMATGSQPPGIWTDELCPAARQPHKQTTFLASSSHIHVFIAEPLNYVEIIPSNCRNHPRASRLSGPRWQTEKAMSRGKMSREAGGLQEGG